MIWGDAAMEYEKVWDYAAAILKYNPGSTVVVKMDGVLNPNLCSRGCMCACKPASRDSWQDVGLSWEWMVLI